MKPLHVNQVPRIASTLVLAIADTDCSVKFTDDGGDNDLAIVGDADDLAYLLESLVDFGVPNWLEMDLHVRAEIVGDLIIFRGIKLRLPMANRRR
jgi:hypothetical protein